MGEIATIFRQLEEHPRVIVISFILCWPVTYSVFYGLWDGLSSFGVFDRVVFSVAIELLVLAAYVLLLSGVMSMRKQKQLSLDRTITIGRIFGPIVYSELLVFCSGIGIKNHGESESMIAFVSAFVLIIVLFVFVWFEIRQLNSEYKKQKEVV